MILVRIRKKRVLNCSVPANRMYNGEIHEIQWTIDLRQKAIGFIFNADFFGENPAQIYYNLMRNIIYVCYIDSDNALL